MKRIQHSALSFERLFVDVIEIFLVLFLRLTAIDGSFLVPQLCLLDSLLLWI